MQKKLQKQEKILGLFVLLIMLVALVPLYIVADYAHPSVDDYSYGKLTAEAWEQTGSLWQVLVTAWERTAYTYETHQGTFVSVFLMRLQPGIFGEDYYFLTTVFLLSTFLVCSILFYYAFFNRIFKADRVKSWIIAAVLSLGAMEFTHVVSDSFYWYNGGITYTFFYSMEALLFAMLIYMYTAKKKAVKCVLCFICMILAVVACGGNYVTSLVTLELLVFVCAVTGLVEYKWIKKENKKKASVCKVNIRQSLASNQNGLNSNKKIEKKQKKEENCKTFLRKNGIIEKYRIWLKKQIDAIVGEVENTSQFSKSLEDFGSKKTVKNNLNAERAICVQEEGTKRIPNVRFTTWNLYLCLFVLLAAVVTFLFVVIAPGNALRQEKTGEANNPVIAILLSFVYGAYSLGNCMDLSALLLLFFCVPLFVVIAGTVCKERKFMFPCPVLVTFFSFCLYSSQVTPVFYAQGIKLPYRIMNIIYFSCFVMVALNLFYWIGYLSTKRAIGQVQMLNRELGADCHGLGSKEDKKTHSEIICVHEECSKNSTSLDLQTSNICSACCYQKAHKFILQTLENWHTNHFWKFYAIAALLLCFSVAGNISIAAEMDVEGAAQVEISELPATLSACYFLFNGDAKVFDKECKERYTLYSNPEVKDVIVEPFTVTPDIIFHSDITEDPDNWKNKCIKKYFNKHSVKLAN